MRSLAAAPQNPQMAALKEATPFAVPAGNMAARGRDNFSLLGVLRTKPGRADSPPTLSMSCSDKIAKWGVLGVQGALASHIFEPIYLDEIVMGSVPPKMQDTVMEDCERAFRTRLEYSALAALPYPYLLHVPAVSFTQQEFSHGKAQLTSEEPPSPSNESICWVSTSGAKYEVLINGLRRGVGEKQRERPELRPLVSKNALFSLYRDTVTHMSMPPIPDSTTYFEVKQAATEYQQAKSVLQGENGPFSGWKVSDEEWERFKPLDGYKGNSS